MATLHQIAQIKKWSLVDKENVEESIEDEPECSKIEEVGNADKGELCRSLTVQRVKEDN